jgi:hypothetical protein
MLNLQDLMELGLFLNGKTRGPGPQRCGPAVRSGPQWTKSRADRRRSGAPGTARPRSSLPVAREDEEDEAVPRGCSPEHGQRQRGRVIEAKSGGDSSSA